MLLQQRGHYIDIFFNSVTLYPLFFNKTQQIPKQSRHFEDFPVDAHFDDARWPRRGFAVLNCMIRFLEPWAHNLDEKLILEVECCQLVMQNMCSIEQLGK